MISLFIIVFVLIFAHDYQNTKNQKLINKKLDDIISLIALDKDEETDKKYKYWLQEMNYNTKNGIIKND